MKPKPLNKNINLLNFMKPKHLIFFFIFFLFLPFSDAYYTVDYNIPFTDKYCEVYSVEFTPDELSVNYDPSLTYVVTNIDYSNKTKVFVNTSYNKFVNGSNATVDNGFWDFVKFLYYKGIVPQRPSMSDWKNWVFGPFFTSMGASGTNLVLEGVNQIRKIFAVKNDYVAYGSPLNATFPIGYGSTFTISVCQDTMNCTLGPLGGFSNKCFDAKIYFPEANYKPCDDKRLYHYFLEIFSTIVETIISFIQLLTELWFIVYWILKIGIIVGVVYGAIWLIFYIYRLVRDALA